MRKKYSTALLTLLLAAPSAAQCPPAIPALAAKIEALRHVTPKLAPPCRSVDRIGLRKELDRKLRRDLPVPPEVFITALVKLGFATGNVSAIYQHLLAFYGDQVLGFYEPADDELVLVEHQGALPGDEMVWAHELEHAAQEHRFKLATRLLAMRDNSDEQRAASAVAEGEALLVMFLLERGGKGDDRETLANAERIMELTDAALPVPEGVPEYFVKELEFPYTAGFTALLAAFRSGGWDAVDALLKRPPATTTELLHPGRAVTTPGVTNAELPAAPAGFEEVLTDTLGEWALAFWLGQARPAQEASALAASWDGDRLRLVRQKDDDARWALAWVLRCRTESERRGVEKALKETLPGLLGGLDGSGRAPSLTWSSAGRSLSLRAAWPQDSRPGPKPS